MADRKITQFESFAGEPNNSVYFIIASGEAENVNAKNYKIPFNDISFFVQRDSLFGDNSPFPVTEDDSFVKIGGVNTSLDKGIQLTVNADPVFSSTSELTTIYKDTEFTSTSTEAQHLYSISGDFSQRLRISGADVLTGFDLSNDGYNALSSSSEDVNIGDSTASNFSKNLKFYVNGVNKMEIKPSSIEMHSPTIINSSLSVSSPSLFRSDVYTEGQSFNSGHIYNSGNHYVSGNLVSSGDAFFNNKVYISGTGMIDDSIYFKSRDAKLLPEASDFYNQCLYDYDGSLYYGEQPLLSLNDLAIYFDGHVTQEDFASYQTAVNQDIASATSSISISSIYDIQDPFDPTSDSRLSDDVQDNSFLVANETALTNDDGSPSQDEDGNQIYSRSIGWSTIDIPNNISDLNDITLSTPQDGDLLVYSDQANSFINVVGSSYLNTSSDLRLKTELQEISESISKIKKLTPKYFTWNELSKNEGVKDIGVIAQNVQEVLPEAVQEGPDGYLTVSYHKIIPLLIQAFQDQQKEIELLKDKLKNV